MKVQLAVTWMEEIRLMQRTLFGTIMFPERNLLHDTSYADVGSTSGVWQGGSRWELMEQQSAEA